MSRAALLPLLLVVAGCAPQAEPLPPVPTLDCAKGFDGLAAEIAASPTLRQAPKEPGEPYRFYASVAGGTAFVVTEPGAPGHPAVIRQQSAGGQMHEAGCRYGDEAGYDQLVAYLKSLAAAR